MAGAEDDVTRRTWLAAERTWLAWWRTALAASVAALAVGRLIPDVADVVRWPFALLGGGYALLALGIFLFGRRRWRAVERALRDGTFEPLAGGATDAVTFAGAGLALATLLLILLAL